MASLKNTTINDTGFLQLPSGTDAQRPSPVNGMMRYNTTSGQVEIYNGSWRAVSTNYDIEVILVAGGGGGGASRTWIYGGGGGGGAGGFVNQVVSVTPGTNYSLTVGGGGGGSSRTAQFGSNGGNTTGFSLTARGGQGARSYDTSSASFPDSNVGSAGGASRDSDQYGIPNTLDGQGNNGAAGKVGCGASGGGGGAGANGYTGRTDCDSIRFLTTSCGGNGVKVNWTGTLGGIVATTVKAYAVYGGGTRAANYTVEWSDDGRTWTSAFTGNMSSSACGVITGSGTGNGSYGRHFYWRYSVGSATVGHHPRISRLWLEDASGNQYLIRRWVNDNCNDWGCFNFTQVQSYLEEGVWYAGGAGGSYEGNADRNTFANGGQLPERGGRGSSGINGNVTSAGSDGDANSGFGGGGVNAENQRGGYNGGSGIIMLRYSGPQRGSGGTVTSANGYTIHTFTSSGTFTA